jgi:hypothetical protein
MAVEWASLATFVSVCCAATAGLLHTIQQSRCTTIRMCGGLFECNRKVPDIEPTDELQDQAADTIASGDTSQSLRIRQHV